jgi:hypothetical protein
MQRHLCDIYAKHFLARRLLLNRRRVSLFTMSAAKKIGIGTVLVAVLLGLIDLVGRSSSRTALETYKTELRAKGEKLTYKELAIRPSTNVDEVACRQTLGACSLPGTGLTPELMEFTSPGRARVSWQGTFHLSDGLSVTGSNWESLDLQNKLAAPIWLP